MGLACSSGGWRLTPIGALQSASGNRPEFVDGEAMRARV
jgi:hypothetical protein